MLPSSAISVSNLIFIILKRGSRFTSFHKCFFPLIDLALKYGKHAEG